MASNAVRRPTLAQKLARMAALAVCCGLGFGAVLGVKIATAPTQDEHAEHDEHDEHDPSAEHTEPPTHQRMNVDVRSGNYAAGLRVARELLAENPADRSVRYALALCLEGLERWHDAIEAYEKLAEGAPDGVKAVAICGEVRCHLGEGNSAEATGAIGRAERLAGTAPGVATEVAYLRGRLALLGQPRATPGPFAPDQPMGDDPRLPTCEYADWLKLPAADSPVHIATPHGGHGSGPTPRGEFSAAEPLAAFAAVLAADPPHPDETAVRLAVANLRFRAGQIDEAAREYKRVRDARPPVRILMPATYNLGLIRHRLGEWAVARGLLTDSADLAAGTPAGAMAWWWVGRVELDTGNIDACRKAWDRADEVDDRQMTAAAQLGRVFLKLLAGDHERAEAFLKERRVANLDPMPALGQAFTCYLRHAGHPTELNRGELTAALREAEYGVAFGPAGRFLFAGWLGQAGEPKEMLKILDAASEVARGPWAVRIALAGGESLFATGHRAAARGRLTAAAAADGGEYGDRARVRLAELALDEGKADECVQLCRQVLARDYEDRTKVLRLLGRGYELQNRPRAAAECFAGRLPTQ
ncbi:MAG: tetratricopeptide repeat protein [Fimbriiglobus sp.]|jgi:tetratricopeptide (TPR) repeat protein|nr:tetratricopeptide repeat protein [Fimbriiglobus sp.]